MHGAIGTLKVVKNPEPRMVFEGEEITDDMWSTVRGRPLEVTFSEDSGPRDLIPLVVMRDRGFVRVLPRSDATFRKVYSEEDWGDSGRTFGIIVEDGTSMSLMSRLKQLNSSIARVAMF